MKNILTSLALLLSFACASSAQPNRVPGPVFVQPIALSSNSIYDMIITYGGGGGSGGASNAVSRIQTNSVTLLTGATNINFVAGANTTVTGHIAGATAIIGISSAASALPSFSTLTDGATITWTVTPNAINHASVTLGGNRTLAFSGSAAGTRGTLVVYQDGTGSRTLTLPSGSLVQGNGGGIILLSTAANSVDVLEFVHFGTNYLWSIGNKFN